MYGISLKKIGDVWYGVALKGRVIGACGFSIKGRRDLVSKLLQGLPYGSEFSEAAPEGYASETLEALSQVFEGEPAEQEFPLEVERFSPFTRKVLNVTARIPRGFVATYGGIAKAVGNERAARAVGSVQASNPFAPIVPCHRVVDSKLELHGYGSGLKIKRILLEREGVVFEGNRVARKCLWTP